MAKVLKFHPAKEEPGKTPDPLTVREYLTGETGQQPSLGSFPGMDPRFVFEELRHAEDIFQCRVSQKPELVLAQLDYSKRIRDFRGNLIPFKNFVVKIGSVPHEKFHGLISLTQTGPGMNSSIQLIFFTSYLFLSFYDFVLYLNGLKNTHSVFETLNDNEAIELASKVLMKEGGRVIGRKEFLETYLTDLNNFQDQMSFHASVDFILKIWAMNFMPLA